MQAQVYQLIAEQKSNWALAKKNYEDLSATENRSLYYKNTAFTVQHNPARIRSTAAKTDANSIAKRACFLCASNRPSEQKSIPFKENYELLINPYPIFEHHLTIVSTAHRVQELMPSFYDLLSLSSSLADFAVFYNGANCGASAPDHFHFQACLKKDLPTYNDFESKSSLFNLLSEKNGVALFLSRAEYLRTTLVLESDREEELFSLFSLLNEKLKKENEAELMMNLFCTYEKSKWQIFLFPRAKQRPDEFYADEPHNLLLSPALVEMAGLIILPRTVDYVKLDILALQSAYNQVSMAREEVESKIFQILE